MRAPSYPPFFSAWKRDRRARTLRVSSWFLRAKLWLAKNFLRHGNRLAARVRRRYFSEGEKRRPEMRLRFAGYRNAWYSGYFYFPDASQISTMVGDHSRQLYRTIVGYVGEKRNCESVGDGFRSLPIPQIAGLQSPYHASFNLWRTFHFRPNSSGESERELWRLSDISGTVG